MAMPGVRIGLPGVPDGHDDDLDIDEAGAPKRGPEGSVRRASRPPNGAEVTAGPRTY